jgi:hypothetical protein
MVGRFRLFAQLGIDLGGGNPLVSRLRMPRYRRADAPRLSPQECANYVRHAAYASKRPESALC